MSRERPILFSAPMVRAILDGRKTQTRRIVKNPEWTGCLTGDCPHDRQADCDAALAALCPYGAPGDRLWVREAWAVKRHEPHLPHERDYQDLLSPTIRYLADGAERRIEGDRAGFGCYHGPVEKGRPSIHMPRWASRILLEIVEIRVERLQDISTVDVLAEGAPVDHSHRDHTQDGSNPVMCLTENAWTSQTPRAWFHRLWEQINGEGSWDANPWAWVVDFRRVAQEARAA